MDNLPAAVAVARKRIAAQLELDNLPLAHAIAWYRDGCTATQVAPAYLAARNQWRALLLIADGELEYHQATCAIVADGHERYLANSVACSDIEDHAEHKSHTVRIAAILARLAPLDGFEPLRAAMEGEDG